MENRLSQTTSQPSKRISTEERDAWLMSKITMGEILKPGAPPILNEDSALDKLMERYSELLDEIGPKRFEAAYDFVLDTSKFRPDISELRAAAGVTRQNPFDVEALAQFKRLIQVLRKHGRKLQMVLGEILNDGKDDEGLVLQVPKRAPSILPPELPTLVEATVLDMGYGSSQQVGLDAVWAHPAFDDIRDRDELDQMGSFRASAAEKIERRWIQHYTRNKSASLNNL